MARLFSAPFPDEAGTIPAAGRVSGGLHPFSALALVMGYACLVTLDGLVDLVDPNFRSNRN
jgi:hypothetical protein